MKKYNILDFSMSNNIFNNKLLLLLYQTQLINVDHYVSSNDKHAKKFIIMQDDQIQECGILTTSMRARACARARSR